MESQKSTVLVCFAVPEESTYLRRRRPEIPILHTGMGAANAIRSLETYLRSNHPSLIVSAGFAGGLNPALTTGTILVDGLSGSPSLNPSIQEGSFHCAERVIATVAEKSKLRQKTGCDAVEMESAHLRKCADQRGIKSWTVRVISDAADEPLPLDFNQLMTSEMTLSFPKLIAALARQPLKIAELLRFQRQIKSAAEKLGAAIDRLLPRSQ